MINNGSYISLKFFLSTKLARLLNKVNKVASKYFQTLCSSFGFLLLEVNNLFILSVFYSSLLMLYHFKQFYVVIYSIFYGFKIEIVVCRSKKIIILILHFLLSNWNYSYSSLTRFDNILIVRSMLNLNRVSPWTTNIRFYKLNG